MKNFTVLLLLVLALFSVFASAQTDDFTTIRCEVHFDRTLRPWEGFGFNYVEETQFRKIETNRQDYGGFSYLDEESRQDTAINIWKRWLATFNYQNVSGPPFIRKKRIALTTITKQQIICCIL